MIMRKIIAEVSVSLNGYLEGPQGDLNWVRLPFGEEFNNMLAQRYDTIFYGRRAYQRIVSRFIDDIHDDCPVGKMRKFVFSNSVKHIEGNAMVIHSNFYQEVERIRDEEGLDIWLYGGRRMIETFAAHNLIDEFLIYVHPIVLQGGIQLFSFAPTLRLKGSEILADGIVKLNYEVIK
jgi:dihydrofolate reductase